MKSQRHLFDIEEGIAYLNGAYMSPQLKSVTQAGQLALGRKEHPWTIHPNDFFTQEKELRNAFAQLVAIDDANQVAIIPSASYGLANAAKNTPMRAGQTILMVEEQFPSNYYVWANRAKETGARIECIGPSGPDRASSWNQAILDAIGPDTCVVTMGHVHWADGTLFDLKRIRERLDEYGGYLVIDGTQSVGALPFSVADIRPDALIVAGYKWLLGPYSLGLAYYGPRYGGGNPIEENWINRKDSEQFGGLVRYQPAYQPGAGRYSVGEKSNFVLVPMLKTALEQLLRWTPEAIQKYTAHIAEKALAELMDMACYVEPYHLRAHHLYGIRLPEAIDGEALEKAFRNNRVFISRRGTALRISPHVYNTEEDFEELVFCFKSAFRQKA